MTTPVLLATLDMCSQMELVYGRSAQIIVLNATPSAIAKPVITIISWIMEVCVQLVQVIVSAVKVRHLAIPVTVLILLTSTEDVYQNNALKTVHYAIVLKTV
jgi:hypothetical protein